MTRSLSDDERAVITRMLTLDAGDEHTGLLSQVPYVTVVGGSVTSRELSTGAAAATSVPAGAVAAIGVVRTPLGEVVGMISLWVKDGRLSSLDYGWVTDEPPLEFPSDSWVEVQPRLQRPTG